MKFDLKKLFGLSLIGFAIFVEVGSATALSPISLIIGIVGMFLLF